MDIQTLSYVVERISTVSRLAEDSAEFKSLIDVLSMELQDEMDRIESAMYNEMFMRDSDGSACLGLQVA